MIGSFAARDLQFKAAMIGSFAARDLQLKASYASLPPCIPVFVFLLYRNSSMYRFNSHSRSCRSNKTQRAFSDSRRAGHNSGIRLSST